MFARTMIGILALAAPAAAFGVPSTLNYTGELTAENGLPYEGTVAVTATIGGTAKAPTMSGTAKWTVEDSTTEFKLTGKPAAALEGTSWTLTITPRPLEGDEEADDPFEERLTFFDGKAWLSSDSLPELEPVAAAPKAAASGGHEVKVTLKAGAGNPVLPGLITMAAAGGVMLGAGIALLVINAKRNAGQH